MMKCLEEDEVFRKCENVKMKEKISLLAIKVQNVEVSDTREAK